MKAFQVLLGTCVALGLATVNGHAVEISIAANSTGNNIKFLQEQVVKFEKDTGNKVNIVSMPSSSSEQFSQYRLWLAAGNADIDVYQTDVVWAPQLSDQFIDLTEATKDVTGAHFPRSSPLRRSMGSWSHCRFIPTHQPCFTVRICSKNTTSRFPGHGMR